jgi:hypothetical protein
VHSALRRLAVLLVLVLPVSLIGRAGSTWGAAPAGTVPPRPAREVVFPAPAVQRVDAERSESAVVLVVLDGVRWQDVFYGADGAFTGPRGLGVPAWSNPRALLPHLYRFIDSRAVAIGAPGHGATIAASGPQFISLPGYLEIFAGKPDPACDYNECARPPARTIADDVVDSAGAAEVAVVTSWPNIARAASADPSRLVITAGRQLVANEAALRADRATAELLAEGASAAPTPGEHDYRPDRLTGRIALRHLAVARPRFLFVGLGDADEYGHRGDYAGYLRALREQDAFVGELLAALEGMGARGKHTTVIVTADHGRGWDFKDHGPRFPESGRVWLVAGGGAVRGHGLVAASRRHTLSDVAPTVRFLLGIASDQPGQAIPEVIGGTSEVGSLSGL